jgi:G3E family GTPase
MASVPVTVISGFQGVGKTSLLNSLLAQRPDLRIAVVVNNADGVNDASGGLPSGGDRPDHEEVVGSTDAPVQLSSGCVCCSLQEDLLEEVARIAEGGNYDYLLIECSAISEPMPVAEVLLYGHAEDHNLSDVARLDTLVTVVDALTFLDDYLSMDELQERIPGADDDLDLSQLLAEQVEFANVIVLNKADEVPEEHRGFLKSFLQQLNPEARVVEATHGDVSSELLLNTNSYQDGWEDAASSRSATVGEQNSDEDDSELSGYGVTSFTFRSRRPFHPERFYEFWVSNPLTEGIFRSRGCFWLATRCMTAGMWSQAGSVISAQPGGTWWSETPREEWPSDDAAAMAEIQSLFAEPWGDRRQDLLVIGQDLDEAAITKALDACLLNDQEMKQTPEAWQLMPDPFASWDVDTECGDDCDDEHHDHSHRG